MACVVTAVVFGVAAAATGARAADERVLFLGDSIMDQQGGHAAFLLRQSGIDARVEARWGSTLFTLGQYARGQTRYAKPSGDRATHWLSLVSGLLAGHEPALVVASLNHNYWLPLPTDAAGAPIVDLQSDAARRMIDQQVGAFVGLVRGAGAEVVWVAPTDSATRAPDLWPAIAATLGRLGVDVVDANAPLRDGRGGRAATARDCDGHDRALWFDDDVHLTRFGAGRSGTALARAVAARLGRPLRDASAPGEPTVAIVPARAGYYLVQCDGSVFRFGGAPELGSARSQVAGGPSVVAARLAPDGGLRLVRADGDVLDLGPGGPDGSGPAPPGLQLARPGSQPVLVTGATPGYWVVSSAGDVHALDGAPRVADAREVLPSDPVARAFALEHPRPAVTAAAAAGGGLLVVTENGEVTARGGARFAGDTAHLALYTG